MGKLSKLLNKTFSFLSENILFIETLVLLMFIPLYPKLPLLDIRNTWVYIRAEDFLVVFVLLTWITLLLKKKITLKTPLTIPIFIFWIIGGIATIHGVLLVFPTLANVFPNIAFFNLLRHIEYLSLFFIAFQGMKEKRFLPVVITVLVTTVVGVVLYGFGQKYLEFPAYLTMNEEFAKGIPIQLSALSRIPSTFGGHYDLAAYLVLMIPLLVSLAFGFKNRLIKLFLLGTSFFGFILLFMTVSRVSFFVLFISLLVIFFFQKRKIVFLAIPMILLTVIIFVSFQPSLLNRFKSTVSQTDVLVDAQTGESVGNIKLVPKAYFKDKLVLQKRVKDKEELALTIGGEDQGYDYSSTSAVFPFKYIPPLVPYITTVDLPTGENLPQGTSYINLYLSPVERRVGNFFYEIPPDLKASIPGQVLVIHGDFIIKRAAAYDISFTTRFQGEWPRALEAFSRNILVGSGYGSVSMAVDNNYLRILGEIGLLGFVSFFAIFLSLGIYIKKIYPDIDSKLAKSFILGFGAGVIGLALNATLIDVFEASKIAYLLWLLSGITLGLLVLYQKREFSLYVQIRKAATSKYAIIVYIFLLTIVLYSPILNNYFVGDDFTWLRWAADCKNNCSPLPTILHYFTSSDGFFYRPGTKLYFYLMYQSFWLNQVIYHMVSIFLHFAVTTLLFILARKIFKKDLLAFSSALLFLILSGPVEGVFWIAATGHLFNAMFGILSLLLFIAWEEKRKYYYYIGSFICVSLALIFHELGVVFPLLILAYKYKEESLSGVKNLIKKPYYLLLFVPDLVYLLMRFAAGSYWLHGDYSYDLLKLPFNFIGNGLGYAALSLIGPMSLPGYNLFRSITRENLMLTFILIPVVIAAAVFIYKLYKKGFSPSEKKIIVFGFLFFAISLLPFLGLGNITSRYDYLASFGIVIIFVVLIRKTYEYLLFSGKEIAIGGVTVFVIIFSLFHIIQAQQTYFQWNEAGNKAKNFFISLEEAYSDSWSKDNVEFYFVNVPIKVGEAWVFPVGIQDAVWFAFNNENAKINLYNDLNSAVHQAGLAPNKNVLRFNDDGSVKLIDRVLDPVSGQVIARPEKTE